MFRKLTALLLTVAFAGEHALLAPLHHHDHNHSPHGSSVVGHDHSVCSHSANDYGHSHVAKSTGRETPGRHQHSHDHDCTICKFVNQCADSSAATPAISFDIRVEEFTEPFSVVAAALLSTVAQPRAPPRSPA